MSPGPGLVFRLAPRFAVQPRWAERLSLSDGLTPDGVVRPDWRTLGPAELAALVPGARAPTVLPLAGQEPGAGVQGARAGVESAGVDPGAVSLFAIPDHLRASWWEVAAEQPEALSGEAAFDLAPFLGPFLEFCQFKGLPVPAPAASDVLISASGSRSVRGRFGGPPGEGDWRVVVNLGDEPASVLTRARAGVVRCALEPGEGLLIPAGCPADAETIGKADIDVLFVVRTPPASLVS